MSRVRLACVSVTIAVAGCLPAPAAASAAVHDKTAACTKDTTEVTRLATAVTTLGTTLNATPLDPARISRVSGDLYNAVTAAQAVGCLPPLPSSAPSPHDVSKCAADAVQLLAAVLGQIGAAITVPPDASAVLAAAQRLPAAIIAVDGDSCLPISLPVPTVPVPPVPPVS